MFYQLNLLDHLPQSSNFSRTWGTIWKIYGGIAMPCGDVGDLSAGVQCDLLRAGVPAPAPHNDPKAEPRARRGSSGPGLVQYLVGLCAACLPSLMSTKKKPSPTSITKVTKVSPKKSASSALPPARKRLRRDTWPAMTSSELLPTQCVADTEYVHQYLGLDRVTLRSSKKPFFPFDSLPELVKLKIFKMLTPVERGQASGVCREWNHLMRDPSVWTCVDLTDFPLCTQQHTCGPPCYNVYKKRLKQYMAYLENVQPSLKRLRFSFDIYEPNDKWLKNIESFLRAARCQELAEAQLNWKETPHKPIWSENYAFGDRHRSRQRKFVHFFDEFTKMAPRVERLVVPFDWSDRSLASLCRLQRLHTLVLQKYFVFQQLSEEALEGVLQGLPQLERLILEVWTPSGRGLLLYSITAPRLKYLDISQCRGFYLKNLDAPQLDIFKVSRHPWNGPLTCTDHVYIPCLYDILRTGTPNLKQLNEHTLHASWTSSTYPELDTVLKSVCSCRQHKSGWAM